MTDGVASGARRLLQRLHAHLTGGARRSPTAHRRLLERIRAREAELARLDDRALREEAARLRRLADADDPPTDLRTTFFALACELAHRTLDLRPYDVQLLGALALSEGRVVEMAAGEGKTLTAVLPAALAALTGRGFHVLTANDYLARRDAAWMGPLYRALGLTVGHVGQDLAATERRTAYAADVTYVTATEAGFDYLRDGLAMQPEEVVQRARHAVLVDEVDSILIDEARIPLVIAGGSAPPEALVLRATQAVAELTDGRDFAVDHGSRKVSLTDDGIARLEARLDCGNLFESHNLPLVAAVDVALHARAVLRRDVDYIVRDDRVQLVDEFKGRVADRRRWPDGVHTALEAREGLPLTREGRVLGTLTLQSFIGLYAHVAGMTGTAATQVEEFRERYGLTVVVVPPNRPCVRRDHPDLLFLGREAKETALERDLRRWHAAGRPVLVGTASVAESERLARRFRSAGVEGSLLNARNDELEATIVAEAGDLGAVTISTNMAGRGTDIKLGGAGEERADAVRKLGGLVVVGTNRHESRRIDLQLRGRAGRQGDPGESRFYVSLEDELFARHGLREYLPPGLAGSADPEPVDDPRVGRELERSQRILEARHADLRKRLWRYDFLLERQRRILRELRDDVLAGAPFLAERAPERHAGLVSRLGETRAAEAERRVVLSLLDQLWSDHLAEVAEVREGIVLRVIGRQDPLFEFQKIAVERFDALLAALEHDALETLDKAELDGAELRLDGCPPAPGATWTYLTGEDDFRKPGGGFMLGLARLLWSRRPARSSS